MKTSIKVGNVNFTDSSTGNLFNFEGMTVEVEYTSEEFVEVLKTSTINLKEILPIFKEILTSKTQSNNS